MSRREIHPHESPSPLSSAGKWAVLLAAMGGLVFDGFELGLMPVVSLSVSQSLLGEAYTPKIGGDWFARYTAALMFGAAIGGIVLGRLGDVWGRSRTLGVSILFYSLFAGLGAYVQTQEQMLILRFFVGLGVGGVWPNAIALVSECWSHQSRPTISGVMSAALNGGILLLSQIAGHWHVTPESWRWLFYLASVPAVLGLVALCWLPESPAWLASRTTANSNAMQPSNARPSPIRQLLRPPLLRRTLIGVLLGTIPLIGAWAASKWMIPWADSVSKLSQPGYKATVQGWWATGAVLGSFTGAQFAAWCGRRLSYFLISIGATLLTLILFLGSQPLEPSFVGIVFSQAFVATLFFGWLALYLPELFPTNVRATGTGISYNTGRFATAIGVFLAGVLFTALDGSYSKVGAICGLIYALGAIVIIWAPETTDSASH